MTIADGLGAMVLAHSLRDNGTKAKLVALFTPDRLQSATIDELRTVYDELIPVSSMVNDTPANLWLMDRPDLIATFTKIELWRLTQYQRVVYIDCDVVALRAPDELLSLEADFAAAPDVGWPDCFNSGLMVLRPNLQDYYALRALAQRGISFDGADQGLLNMHFQDWHRLSFTYNCTPSANYQYIPAYKHFQSTISLIHFIGSQKPWNMPRQIVPLESPYNQLLGRWWAIYDQHYRLPFVSPSEPQGSHDVAAFHEGHYEQPATSETWPQPYHVVPQEDEGLGSSYHEDLHQVAPSFEPIHEESPHQHHVEPSHHTPITHHNPAPAPTLSMVPQYVRGEEHVSTFVPPLPRTAPITFAPPLSHETYQTSHAHHEPPNEGGHEQEHHQQSECGHIHQPQPVAPIASVVESFQPPRSPSPEIFEAPQSEWNPAREPPPANTKPEGLSLQEKTYFMSEDTQLFQPPSSYPEAPKNMYYQVPTTKPEPQTHTTVFPWEHHAPKPTRVFAEQSICNKPFQPPAHEEHEENHNHQEHQQHQEHQKHQEYQEHFHDPPSEPVRELSSEPQRLFRNDAPTPGPLYTRVPYEPSATYNTYDRSNAWDEDPEIQRFIERQQARRKPAPPSSSSHSSPGKSPSKVTDFPTEIERPSLPVTPAPIHRTLGEDSTSLPSAEGVPDQEDWVGVTVDAFSSLLSATYLLWRSTESGDQARGAEADAGRGLPGSGTAV
ncbi:unnamed protein product [Penicillium olsonii]|uniref:glycogenin glucosyltransferase n=1 Tax=Penicillium olsonii TaxID=99116 RepID=A0A9W4MY61_PENOL|nr:unnamed protein product [Penicillium olsonii]CAG8179830.1 unnamed protein product [Penicillium olsonii]